MYSFGGVAYRVGPNLELIKAAKYDRTQIRVDDKGRKWQFNEQTRRWRLADKQQPANGATGGAVAGMQVVQDAPKKQQKPKAPKAAPAASGTAELKPKGKGKAKPKATPGATAQPPAVKPKKGRSPKPKASPELTPKQNAQPQQTMGDGLDKLRANYKEVSRTGNLLTDDGNKMWTYADEIKQSGTPNPADVERFKQGQANLNPVMIRQIGKNQYEALTQWGANLIASALAADPEARLNTLIVPNNPEDIRAAKSQEEQLAGQVFFGKNPMKTGKFLTDVGNLRKLYTDEVSGADNNPTPATTQAARDTMETSSRNWVPVLVRSTGNNQYEVVGNQAAYQMALQTGNDRIWGIIVEDILGTTGGSDVTPAPTTVKPKGRSPKSQVAPSLKPKRSVAEQPQPTDGAMPKKRERRSKSAPVQTEPVVSEPPGGAIVPSPGGQLAPTASPESTAPPSDTAIAQMGSAVQKTAAQVDTAKNSAYRLGQASRQLIRTTNDASKTLAQGVQSAKATIGQALQGASRETQIKTNSYLNNTASAVKEIRQATATTQQRIESNLNTVAQKIEGAERVISGIAADIQAASKRKRGSGILRRQTTKSLQQVQQLALELDQTAKDAVKDALTSVGELGQAVGRSRSKAEASAQETLGSLGGDARRVAGAVKQAAGQMGSAFDAAQSQVMNAANDVKSEARNLYQAVRQVGRRAEAMVQKMLPGQPMQKALPAYSGTLRPKRVAI